MKHADEQLAIFPFTPLVREPALAHVQNSEGLIGARVLPRSGGWLFEESLDSSTDKEHRKSYSLPRHKILEIFHACCREGLIDLPTSESDEVTSIMHQHGYCLYYLSIGHVIHDCHIFRHIVEDLIAQGVIEMGYHLVNPSLPHALMRPSFFVNVIHASTSCTSPESETEEASLVKTSSHRGVLTSCHGKI